MRWFSGDEIATSSNTTSTKQSIIAGAIVILIVIVFLYVIGKIVTQHFKRQMAQTARPEVQLNNATTRSA